MSSVAKADIERQLLAYLVLDEPLYDRSVSEVRQVVVACANVIAEVLRVEGREDADDLEEMIAFTRRCIKVRECERRSLATTLRDAMRNSLFDNLPEVERQSLTHRLTERVEEMLLTR
jgi:hypothetical protein